MKSLMLAVMLCMAVLAAMAAEESPYKGQQDREIKALSQQEVERYLSGAGMGFARAAELNDYPGPKHVLDMAGELELSAEQIRQTRTIFAAMQSQAVDLGKQLVEKERELDRKFAERVIDTQVLDRLTIEIGMLKAKIRYTHLAAHLEQTAILSEHQIETYASLRGYGSQRAGHHAGSH